MTAEELRRIASELNEIASSLPHLGELARAVKHINHAVTEVEGFIAYLEEE